MTFPLDYPFSPPHFRFNPPIFHPNVYKDGRLCISILHSSGDTTSGELDAETWSPAQSVESVLISIVSLLSDPNISSPANVDAAVMWKSNIAEFNKQVRLEVERSKRYIPKGFNRQMEQDSAYVAPKSPRDAIDDIVGDEFWYESEDSGEEQPCMSDEFEYEEDNAYDSAGAAMD